MADSALDAYLKTVNTENLWTIQPSPKGGRGVFATRDIPANTILFAERALILGPRTDPRCPFVCVGCYNAYKLRSCPGNCGLPVCGCAQSANHRECEILAKIDELTYRERMDIVAPLQAVFLSSSDRDILWSLEGHHHSRHVPLLINLRNSFDTEDLALVRKCCQVLDATAYEVPTQNGGSVRAVYSVAALVNHDCSPNTRHWATDLQMTFATTRYVKKGEEITISYTCVSWTTDKRRKHLMETKNFHCACRRCNKDD